MNVVYTVALKYKLNRYTVHVLLGLRFRVCGKVWGCRAECLVVRGVNCLGQLL